MTLSFSIILGAIALRSAHQDVQFRFDFAGLKTVPCLKHQGQPETQLYLLIQPHIFQNIYKLGFSFQNVSFVFLQMEQLLLNRFRNISSPLAVEFYKFQGHVTKTTPYPNFRQYTYPW